MIRILARNNNLQLSAEVRAVLLTMSGSSIDRYLDPVHQELSHGLSTTKPGKLLKKSIPVRKSIPWEEE
jgi:hypothetical protein